jgi:hypothetical protein
MVEVHQYNLLTFILFEETNGACSSESSVKYFKLWVATRHAGIIHWIADYELM